MAVFAVYPHAKLRYCFNSVVLNLYTAYTEARKGLGVANLVLT